MARLVFQLCAVVLLLLDYVLAGLGGLEELGRGQVIVLVGLLLLRHLLDLLLDLASAEGLNKQAGTLLNSSSLMSLKYFC